MVYTIGPHLAEKHETKSISACPLLLQRHKDGVLCAHHLSQVFVVVLRGVCVSHALLVRAMMSELGH